MEGAPELVDGASFVDEIFELINQWNKIIQKGS